MALESPLFQSSMELLGHAVTHFNGTEELDRKLLILHLANSVELILKDMLLDLGESIYKNPKETVTVTGCLETLKAKGIAIPFLNKIELLIDERNALQHRFGSPNELTSIFYMSISMDFFRDILKTHYNKDLDEVLDQFAKPNDLMSFRMRKPSNDSELESLRKLAKIHPLGALLSAMSYLEGKIVAFAAEVDLIPELRARAPWTLMSHRFLARFGVKLTPDMEREMDEVRQIRNLAAHGRKNPTRQEVEKTISVIEKYEKVLESADREKIKLAVKMLEEEREKERVRELGVQGAVSNA
jgi:hypothetical protein